MYISKRGKSSKPKQILTFWKGTLWTADTFHRILMMAGAINLANMFVTVDRSVLPMAPFILYLFSTPECCTNSTSFQSTPHQMYSVSRFCPYI